MRIKRQISENKVSETTEKGITLIALIISIIILIILAAISVSAIYNTGLVKTAIKGTIDFAEEMEKEKIQFIMSEWPLKRAEGMSLEEFLNQKVAEGEFSNIDKDGENYILVRGEYIVTVDKKRKYNFNN